MEELETHKRIIQIRHGSQLFLTSIFASFKKLARRSKVRNLQPPVIDIHGLVPKR